MESARERAVEADPGSRSPELWNTTLDWSTEHTTLDRDSTFDRDSAFDDPVVRFAEYQTFQWNAVVNRTCDATTARE